MKLKISLIVVTKKLERIQKSSPREVCIEKWQVSLNQSMYITCPSDINILKVKIDANCSISGKIENSCLLESHESFTCRDPKINHNIQRKSLVLLEWFRQTRRINSLDFWSAVMDDRSESRILNLALWLLDHLKMIGEFGDKKIWDANCDIWQIF